jgi:hypothetical protein
MGPAGADGVGTCLFPNAPDETSRVLVSFSSASRLRALQSSSGRPSPELNEEYHD